MTRTIGLTGLSGVIASYLGTFLETKGMKIVALDSQIRQSIRPVIAPEAEQIDWVIHFGAHTSIEESWSDPFKYYAGNSSGTLKALEIAHLNNSKFIYISSYVYGAPKYSPIDESHPAEASNPYMGSKLISEGICNEISKQLEFPLIILRPFYIYGPKGKPGRLITDLLNQANRKEALQINNPYPIRDYLFIEDFCGLILKAVTQDSGQIGIYNIGSGNSHSNLEAAHIVRDIFNTELEIIIKKCPRLGDVDDCSMDPEKAKTDFGWQPKYTLPEGLKYILQATQGKTDIDRDCL